MFVQHNALSVAECKVFSEQQGLGLFASIYKATSTQQVKCNVMQCNAVTTTWLEENRLWRSYPFKRGWLSGVG